MKVTISLIFVFIFTISGVSFAQITASETLRTQEILEKEERLRERVRQERFYIKEISVKGSSILNQKQIDNLMISFKRRLLSKNDIERIMKLIETTYEKLGYSDKISDITYRVKGHRLQIEIKEQ